MTKTLCKSPGFNSNFHRKNFAFKCHRDGNEIYAVNVIAFHPTFGTFATAGSDGTFNFWDKDSKQRLKPFGKCALPISAGTFNMDGSIFAYAVSYDWSKVCYAFCKLV
jgi:mRNA export factor